AGERRGAQTHRRSAAWGERANARASDASNGRATDQASDTGQGGSGGAAGLRDVPAGARQYTQHVPYGRPPAGPPPHDDRPLPHRDERGHGAAAPQRAVVGADLAPEPLPLLTQ